MHDVTAVFKGEHNARASGEVVAADPETRAHVHSGLLCWVSPLLASPVRSRGPEGKPGGFRPHTGLSRCFPPAARCWLGSARRADAQGGPALGCPEPALHLLRSPSLWEGALPTFPRRGGNAFLRLPNRNSRSQLNRLKRSAASPFRASSRGQGAEGLAACTAPARGLPRSVSLSPEGAKREPFSDPTRRPCASARVRRTVGRSRKRSVQFWVVVNVDFYRGFSAPGFTGLLSASLPERPASVDSRRRRGDTGARRA